MEQPAPRRYEALDAYRGIAALAIVAFHAYTFTRGYHDHATGGALDALTFPILRNLEAGVSFFFVLSGFVIFLPFARALMRDRPLPATGPYALRRLCRIAPLYYLVLLAFWKLQFTWQASQVLDLLAHLTFVNALIPRYQDSLIAWSVSNEVIYYVLVPPGAALLARWLGTLPPRERLVRLACALLAVVAVSEAYKAVAFLVARPALVEGAFINGFLYFDPLSRGDGFVLGMLLAAAATAGVTLAPRTRAIVAASGAALLLVACLARFASHATELYFHSLCGLAFALLVAATVLAPGQQRAWTGVAGRVPVGLGAISYGVFLWHAPLLRALLAEYGLLSPAHVFPRNLAVLLAVALPLATATYLAIERPAIRWSRRITATPGRPS
jgi:peptidoglycan/LPS O-acetylase OafA/YrhL